MITSIVDSDGEKWTFDTSSIQMLGVVGKSTPADKNLIGWQLNILFRCGSQGQIGAFHTVEEARDAADQITQGMRTEIEKERTYYFNRVVDLGEELKAVRKENVDLKTAAAETWRYRPRPVPFLNRALVFWQSISWRMGNFFRRNK